MKKVNKVVGKLTPASGEPIWLQCARRELGVAEEVGSANNSRILEYHSATSLKATSDSTPWCSAFVSWVLEVCGIESTKSAAARSYLSWGRASQLKLGAICVFQRGDNSWQGHVGFCVGVSGDKVRVLGGNQGDSVSIAEYPKSKLLGARWPV